MADTGQKISELAAAEALDGTELVPVVQGGSTKKSTAAAVETYIKAGLGKSDVGLSNVANERQYSAQNPPPTPSAADIGAVPTSRTVNGKVLSADITLDASDIGAEEELTWDNVPMAGSSNPAKSGGIYDAILKLYPVDTASGDLASFPDGADDIPVVDLKVSIEPLQSGSGDPSPSNVRPISGWTGAEVTRAGKNLLDPSWFAGTFTRAGVTFTKIEAGHYKANGTATVTAWVSFGDVIDEIVPIKTPKGTFAANGSLRLRSYLYYGDTLDENVFVVNNPLINERLQGVRWLMVSGSVFNNEDIYFQVECGSTITAFETPCAQTLPISWQTQAGTVYGGTLDVTTGLLTVTHGYIASYAGQALPGEWISDRDVYAAGTSPTTGAQVVYELASATTYQLTPTEVKTLLGENSIWADCGGVEVEYRADTTAFINKRVEALLALMSEI